MYSRPITLTLPIFRPPCCFLELSLFSNQLATKRYYEEIFTHPIDDVHKSQPMEATMMAWSKKNCSRYGPHLYGGFRDGFYITHLDGRLDGARAKTRLVNVSGMTLEVAVAI